MIQIHLLLLMLLVEVRNIANGDYYTFSDANGAINIGDGTFKFMRGRTYKFQTNGISTDHPFKIYVAELL